MAMQRSFPETSEAHDRPRTAERRWELADIDFESAHAAAGSGDAFALRVAATASFVEAASDLYARNLVAFFAADGELGSWLAHVWEPEELRHGAALRAYVERCWPQFEWERRFRAFVADYSRGCTVAELEPTPALELAARCIVEMGTSALYRTLNACARDPPLKAIAGLIYADEMRHYKRFYAHFRRYRRLERGGTIDVARTLVKRLLATRNEDGRCAYRQVWDFAPMDGGRRFEADYRAFSRRLTLLIRRHAPPGMLTRMILKPLALPPFVVNAATRMSGSLYALWLAAGE
jgi:hypothetical protein